MLLKQYDHNNAKTHECDISAEQKQTGPVQEGGLDILMPVKLFLSHFELELTQSRWDAGSLLISE